MQGSWGRKVRKKGGRVNGVYEGRGMDGGKGLKHKGGEGKKQPGRGDEKKHQPNCSWERENGPQSQLRCWGIGRGGEKRGPSGPGKERKRVTHPNTDGREPRGLFSARRRDSM